MTMMLGLRGRMVVPELMQSRQEFTAPILWGLLQLGCNSFDWVLAGRYEPEPQRFAESCKQLSYLIRRPLKRPLQVATSFD